MAIYTNWKSSRQQSGKENSMVTEPIPNYEMKMNEIISHFKGNRDELINILFESEVKDRHRLQKDFKISL